MLILQTRSSREFALASTVNPKGSPSSSAKGFVSSRSSNNWVFWYYNGSGYN
ncbi:3824_t:CDS:2, partial [Ambispora gerdemannii]